MTFQTFGLSRRHIETMLKTAFEQMKRDLPREYSNILVVQGRARDIGSFNETERNMEAMCDAYSRIITRAVAKVLDSNNKKLYEDTQTLLKK